MAATVVPDPSPSSMLVTSQPATAQPSATPQRTAIDATLSGRPIDHYSAWKDHVEPASSEITRYFRDLPPPDQQTAEQLAALAAGLKHDSGAELEWLSSHPPMECYAEAFWAYEAGIWHYHEASLILETLPIDFIDATFDHLDAGVADFAAMRPAMDTADLACAGAEGTLGDADVALAGGYGEWLADWNESAGIFVSSYFDDDLSGFRRRAPGALIGMTDAHNGMASDRERLQNPDLKTVLTRLVDNYGDKLAACSALFRAVSDADFAEEEAAVTRLSDAAAATSSIAQDLIAILEPYLTSSEIEAFRVLVE